MAWNSLGICSSEHRPGKSIARRLVAFKRLDTSLGRLRCSLKIARVSVPFAAQFTALLLPYLQRILMVVTRTKLGQRLDLRQCLFVQVQHQILLVDLAGA
jgi:hypothetical protein